MIPGDPGFEETIAESRKRADQFRSCLDLLGAFVSLTVLAGFVFLALKVVFIIVMW